jgi:hypothetical protein
LVATRLTHLPYIGAPDQVSLRTEEVITEVVPKDAPPKPEIVPLWIVVLSACAGAIILLLLVFLLWKVRPLPFLSLYGKIIMMLPEIMVTLHWQNTAHTAVGGSANSMLSFSWKMLMLFIFLQYWIVCVQGGPLVIHKNGPKLTKILNIFCCPVFG